MNPPSSLDSLFAEKLFRIPDYQRGYAWQHDQFKAFWEDLINLPAGRAHYTGVLTLKEYPMSEIKETDQEFWLIDAHSYRVYLVIDGQQRLTTFVIFIQAFVDLVMSLPENQGRDARDVFLTENLSVATIGEKFLFMAKPKDPAFRTYKFGYTVDNPSDRYLRHRVLCEPGGGTIDETFYTLNLSQAHRYFLGQLEGAYNLGGYAALSDIYRRLTKRFLFNEYIIQEEFDVFVAFETMNNRGKKLSDLELLKNRLIYLTTLYQPAEFDKSSQRSLRDSINRAWKEVYHQLGRNKQHPLNDDDFLRAHWIMFFKYSRETGRDYIKFLLDEHFTPKRVHQKVERDVELEPTQEVRAEDTDEEVDDHDLPATSEASVPTQTAVLSPAEIREFVTSLQESSVHWFTTFYPELVATLSAEECGWIDRLNRLGMAYFRPLVMAALKSLKDGADRLKLFERIERFIFIAFRLTTAKANYRSSAYYNAARELDSGVKSVEVICAELDRDLAYAFAPDGSFRVDQFRPIMQKKFTEGSGYYGWSAIRYFLYEYEQSLVDEGRGVKVTWSTFVLSERDRVSIEHIYPQTPTPAWNAVFADVPEVDRPLFVGSLGNLLLLSCSINSSLQNDSFEDKKSPKFDAAENKVRNGYADGSHSEIEVARLSRWDAEQIRARGGRLLAFLEKRWGLKFADDTARESLLFLPARG